MKLARRDSTGHIARGADLLLRRTVQAFVRMAPPRGRGLRAVSVIDRLVPPAGDDLFRTRVAGGALMSCNLLDRIQSCIFFTGSYEPEVTDLLVDELRPGDTFLDIGANAGYFSLVASSKCGSAGVVYAFEAARSLADQLRADAKRLGPKRAPVSVYAVAVLDHSASVHLVEPSDAPGELGERYIDQTGDGVGLSVPAVSIDELLPELLFDVAKIDVEGAELKVLDGAVGAIERSRPRLLVIECIDTNLARFGASVESLVTRMAELGYHGIVIRSQYFAPMMAFRPLAE